MTADEIRGKLAAALYDQVSTFKGRFEQESESTKIRWYDQAQGVLDALDSAGLQVVEKAKAKATPKKKEKVVEAEVKSDPKAKDDPFAAA